MTEPKPEKLSETVKQLHDISEGLNDYGTYWARDQIENEIVPKVKSLEQRLEAAEKEYWIIQRHKTPEGEFIIYQKDMDKLEAALKEKT